MNINVKLDKEKEPATAGVHGLSHDGRGIATVHNKTTFISGALPGETVTYKITLKRRQYQEADAIDILVPAAERVTPPCQHAGVCGGCSLQHMSMEAQLTLKQQTLIDQLKHFGRVTPENILPPLNAGSTGYRRKARLGVKYVIKKERLLVGFREKSSNYLAELERCAVLHPRIGEHLPELSQLIASLERFREIPQVELAIGDTDIALVFRHMTNLPETDLRILADFGARTGMHIYLQPNPPQPVNKLWPPASAHRLSYTLPDYQLEYLFHPLDFTQVNLDMNRLMVKQAMDLLAPGPQDSVLDLFCGIGNFTLPAARLARRVTGIEGGAEMVARGRDNAAHNGISNVEFHAANLMEPSPHAGWMQETYDRILLDPPRAGAKEILPWIKRFAAGRIVYVSCNPATLARDAGELVHQHGYRLTHAGIMNMFPHTSHIEAMALFEADSNSIR